MNQRHRATSTANPFDLADFRKTPDSAPMLAPINFAPENN
jgi:hypothetical protein